MLSNKQKLKYYKNKEIAEETILNDAAEDNHIIYGAKAINIQLPSHLNRHTDDFDIFAKSPKKEAKETEKKLDRAYGGDLFYIEKAKYPNTWKVKNRVTKKTQADYTYPEQKVPYVEIGRNRYAKLSWIKKKIKSSLKNPNQSFRFDKDSEALQRIKLFEREKNFLLGE